MSARKRRVATGSAANRMRAVSSRVLPIARRGVHRTRAWAAPNIERTGHVLQDTVAPKVSSALSAAARQIAPDAPPRQRWRKQASIATLTAAAGGAIAGLARRARNSESNGASADGTSAGHAADEDVADEDAASAKNG